MVFEGGQAYKRYNYSNDDQAGAPSFLSKKIFGGVGEPEFIY
jgi:hypothetical protein